MSGLAAIDGFFAMSDATRQLIAAATHVCDAFRRARSARAMLR